MLEQTICNQSRPLSPRRAVVACVIEREGRLLVLKRSAEVASDRGLWHCVTGYFPLGRDPLEQAWLELAEETGLGHMTAQLRERGDVLHLRDEAGFDWTVHTFLFVSLTFEVRLNWENDEARWIERQSLDRLDTVPWLADVQAVFHTTLSELERI